MEIGQFAFDTTTGANVQILDRIEACGYIASVEQLKKDGGTNTYIGCFFDRLVI